MSLGLGDHLAASMKECGLMCVSTGLHPTLLDAWGLSLSLEGFRHFSLNVVGVLGGRVGAFKPQPVFFERFGLRGVDVLEEVAVACTGVGSLCIVDAKRGDIGSTMKGYADAYLAQDSPLAVDVVTLSPYLKIGPLRPALEFAAENNRGVFVLALTSNPEEASVQYCRDNEGRSVAARAVEELAAFDAECGSDSLGLAEAVVGAIMGSAAKDLGIGPESLHGAILAPRFGAQSMGPDELAEVFGRVHHAALASSSRVVLVKGPSPDVLCGAYEEAVNLLS